MKIKLLIILIVVAISSFGQTNVPEGDISGAWSPSNSPYLISGNVTIQDGSLLTIEPGVEIRFAGQYIFMVYGTLLAKGTTNDSIVFTRHEATDESMGKGIKFYNSYADTSVLSYCIIEHGNASGSGIDGYGGGIFVSNSDVLIDRSTIRYNKATSNGGGLTLYKSYDRFTVLRNSIIENNTVSGGNSSYDGGAGIYASGAGTGSFAIIANNLVINNIDDRTDAPNSEGGGGILLSSGDFTVINNTIFGNSSPKGSGILTRDGYEGNIFNNIVWGNTDAANEEQIAIQTGWNPGGTIPPGLNIHDNCIQPEGIIVVYRNTPETQQYNGTNNIQINPLFLSSGNSNFNLLSNSPCINSGDLTTDTSFFSIDIVGNQRIFNDTIDMGAFEYQFEAGPIIADFYSDRNTAAVLGKIQFTDLSTGIPTTWEWDFNDDGIVDSYARNPEYHFLTAGIYTVTLTSSDASQQNTITKTDYITIYPEEDWTELFPEVNPHKRWYHKMAYCGDGKVLLFGGNWEAGWDWAYDTKTWIYNIADSSWTDMQTPNPPSGRSLHSMAFLGANKVLLYGGNNGSNETWVYDYGQNTWAQKVTDQNPLTEYGANMSYLKNGKALLFGGYGGLDNNGRTDETWIYDLSTNTWTKQNPVGDIKPVAREGYGMAYMGNDSVVLFGGGLWNYQNNNETWLYDYNTNTWIQKNPTSSPSGRSYFGMTSIGNKKALLYSGAGDSDETWIYDLALDQWTEKTYQYLQPSSRYGLSLTETSMNGSSLPILFGGNAGGALNDTWDFETGETINEELTASFIGYNPVGVYPLSIQFEDLSFDHVTSWQWDFSNDGSYDSFDQNPLLVYNTPGKYSVKLVVSDGNSFDTLVRTDYINVVNLIPRFETDTTMMYIQSPIQFTDLSVGTPTSWLWNFGDGETSAEQNPSHSYQNTGNFNVSLTIADVYGDTTLLKSDLIHIYPPDHVWGTITTNTNWCLDTVFVVGNVKLSNAKTLSICPGTVIKFLGHHKINVQGTLIADGTLQDSISFLPDDIITGWHGIRFSNTSSLNDSSIFNYCNFKYGKAINDSTNSYGSGGAIYVEQFDKIRINNSTFANNDAATNGGAIYLGNSNIVITKSSFTSNTARDAGAIIVSGSTPILDRLTFTNNIVNKEWYSSGGALYFGGYQTLAVVSNCLISNNTANANGGGIYMWACSPTIINTSIVNNNAINEYGGGIQSNGASPVIKNSIIWGNTAANYNQISGDISSIEYSNIQGGYTGTGNLNIDPNFVNPTSGVGSAYVGTVNDWNLNDNSPCINKGDPATDTSVYKKDIKGSNRILMKYIDMGCHENGVLWNGNNNSIWNNTLNWLVNEIPNDNSNVTITGNVLNNPVISTTVTLNSLWMEEDANLTLSPTADLTISDVFQTINASPGKPTNPSPANASTIFSITPLVTWECTDPESDPLTYDVYYGTNSNPVLVASAITNTTYDPGTLAYNNTYFWKIVAHDNHSNVTVGDIWHFTCQANQPPTITTNAATNITLTTATSGGNIASNGGATVTARGVCWSTSLNPTLADSYTADGSGDGTFVSEMIMLLPNTQYYVRAYATNSEGTAYGNEVVFTTLTSLPTISTSAITNITTNTATSGGNVTYNGGATVTSRGVCWSTSSNPTLADTYTTDGSGDGTFVSEMTALLANTQYFVRAYATNSEGTAYGNEVSFTTATPSLATVTTNSVTNISITSATGGGNVTYNGGAPVTARGVCWSTSSNPSLADAYTTDDSGDGAFVSNITGLSGNTQYYVRAYATNSTGTVYGDNITFTTLPIIEIGDLYAGGRVFYVDGNGGGMVCSSIDIYANKEWGCNGTDIYQTYTSFGSGPGNTDRILLYCSQPGIAASICSNYSEGGYTDWFLPSSDELNLMYVNLQLGGFVVFYPEWYWSSSEYSSDRAWSRNFENGSYGQGIKTNHYRVRPVRIF